MRPPLSAASALRPHSSASIDRHKLPSLHSHNTSLPTLYLPSQGQGHGSSETYSLRDVGFLRCLCPAHSDPVLQLLPTQTQHFCSWDTRHTARPAHLKLIFGSSSCFCTDEIIKATNTFVCMHYSIECLTSRLHLQPTVVQLCAADSHTVSPSHVQLGFTDQPNCQAVSNGMYTPTQSAQVSYMHAFRSL